MKTILDIILLALCLGAVCGLLLAWTGGFRRGNKTASNAVVPGTVPTHPGVLHSRFAENALANKHRLVKQGTDDDEVDLCGANDKPIGVIDDTAAADETLAVLLLGSARDTRIMTAAGEIAAGADVYTAASGKVSALPAVAGTYYLVGTALTAAGADGDEIEVDPCHPRATVVSE